MQSRWLNKSGHNDNAILPLALKLYYDDKIYTDKKWEFKQVFYNQKKKTEDAYKYATTWTIKTDKTVGGVEVVHSINQKSRAGRKDF
jgi:hypothetical protein